MRSCNPIINVKSTSTLSRDEDNLNALPPEWQRIVHNILDQDKILFEKLAAL